jgi:hypothetical protein
MQIQKRPRESFLTRCAAVPADPGRQRILLVAPSSAAAARHVEMLHDAGFDVELSTNPAGASEFCGRQTRRFRLIVVLESETFAPQSAAEFVRGMSQASPNLPCVLLPADASVEHSEIAVRTALRWASVAHVSAAAAH